METLRVVESREGVGINLKALELPPNHSPTRNRCWNRGVTKMCALRLFWQQGLEHLFWGRVNCAWKVETPAASSAKSGHWTNHFWFLLLLLLLLLFIVLCWSLMSSHTRSHQNTARVQVIVATFFKDGLWKLFIGFFVERSAWESNWAYHSRFRTPTSHPPKFSKFGPFWAVLLGPFVFSSVISRVAIWVY